MALMDSRVLEAITGPVPRGWKGGLAAAARERLERPLATAFLFTFHALLSLTGSQQKHYVSPGKSLSVPCPWGQFLLLGEPHKRWLHINFNFITTVLRVLFSASVLLC